MTTLKGEPSPDFAENTGYSNSGNHIAAEISIFGQFSKKAIFTVKSTINRLNSRTKNRQNFFIQTNYEYPIIGTNSVDHAES